MPTATRDIIVIGASLGGVEALKALVRDFPQDLSAAVFVVIHIGAHGLGIIPQILANNGPLPAHNAEDGMPFQSGHIYVAPSDRHMLLEEGEIIRLSSGPKENLSRPAIDPLFRSAAFWYGSRVIGVVLTGQLDDGTSGLWAVKERGGNAIVQDPTDAVAPSMPRSALRYVNVDYSRPLREIPALLASLSSQAAIQETIPKSKEMQSEIEIAQQQDALSAGVRELGDLSSFACPECHGTLIRIKEGRTQRFRCHTGHAFSLETLLSEFAQKSEEYLWKSLRSLEEITMLLEQFRDQILGHEHTAEAVLVQKELDDTRSKTELVRQALMHPKS